jgi:hypothetical protein
LLLAVSGSFPRVQDGNIYEFSSDSRLIAEGREEEAREMIIKYHANGDAEHPIVNLEINEMKEDLALEGVMTKARNYLDFRVMFNSRSHRYRTMLCVAMSWFGQFSVLQLDHFIDNREIILPHTTCQQWSNMLALRVHKHKSFLTVYTPLQDGLLLHQVHVSMIYGVDEKCSLVQPLEW